ncbi:YggS family pyridoxal phosphate-dependent enzyme [Halomonas sp. M20]|uniref:YggS family pyridoxal phosphate-dependent enzyme n=1 Tax=Halomonas sp. M20 TaxID=2763264 RepID=UPI001D0A32B7|nr:YggS family pyridoxal phosphate-dependent enzyme [Halomonas sp. M20]
MSYPVGRTLSELEHNLAAVQQRIVAACRRVNRDPSEVRLLPVSKTVNDDRLRLAYQAGCRELGENKVQEAQRKAEALADLSDLRWSVIGHLQTNKAKHVARFASEFQALDSLRVARALQRRLEAEDRTLEVLVQVNTSNEPSKFGLAPEDVETFVRELPAFTRLQVNGLMTLAIFSDDPSRVRPCFVRLRQLRDRLRERLPTGISMDTLSMGMSGDFELAIEEGATVVRVGQAIFGPRLLPDSYYWPDANTGQDGSG